MGTKPKKKSRRDVFQPPELNKETVRSIVGECRGQDGNWDKQALTHHQADIRYLLGQLAPVHQGVKECKVDASCFARYSGASWTEDPGTFFDLCFMGSVFGYCALDKRDGQYFLTLDGELKPTLSPLDPKFAAWLKTPAGLAVRLVYAMDSGRAADDLLPLCKKAAEGGDVELQYLLGKLHEDRSGTEDDYMRAVIWYQKAAKQGREGAKSGLERCQTVLKALQGDAEAQYQYGRRLEKTDMEKALRFYSDAADQGHRDAAFKCGMVYGLYRNDQEQAVRHFWEAAHKGHRLAQAIAEGMCEKKPYQTNFTSCADVLMALYGGDLSQEDRALIEDNYDLLSPEQKKAYFDVFVKRRTGPVNWL